MEAAVVAEALAEPAEEVPVAVEPVAEALVAEPVAEPVAEALVAEPAAEALAVGPVAEEVPVAVGPVVELVELAREQELVPGQERELAGETAQAASVAVMLSKILTPVHTDRLTRTGSARECFRFKGAIRIG
jgi:ribonuclease E